MYPCIDIFRVQASYRQVCRTYDISLHCHFLLGFVINLSNSALVPFQVMLHLGALPNSDNGRACPNPDRLEKLVHSAYVNSPR